MTPEKITYLVLKDVSILTFSSRLLVEFKVSELFFLFEILFNKGHVQQKSGCIRKKKQKKKKKKSFTAVIHAQNQIITKSDGIT